MTASDTTALTLAIVADVVGIAIALGMWRRSRRRRRAVRSQHPSARSPLSVDLVAVDQGRALRVAARRGAPPLALDIVSFRPADRDGPWDSLPTIDPLLIEPGSESLLHTSLPADVASADVVIAWTARHPTGDLPGSRLFRVPADRDTPSVPSRSAVLGGLPALALAVLLVASGLLVAWSATAPAESSSPSVSAPVTPPPVTPAPVEPGPDSTTVVATTATPVAPVATTPPGTSGMTPTTAPPPTTAATTVAPDGTSTSPSTSSPSTTSPSTTSPSTTSPSTTSPSTSAPAGGPQVVLDARIGPCQFADECLIVGFRIEGFATNPQEYVCEFEDGSRFLFRFDSGGVDDACATGSPDAAITVEIEGIRSETVTRADVAG